MRFLICTDVAARGLDISGLPYVVNVTLPDRAEDYIHRVGRVGGSPLVLAFSALVLPNQPALSPLDHAAALSDEAVSTESRAVLPFLETLICL